MATGTIETAKATNPLKDLLKYGQSVWLDYIRRDLLTSGELKRLIEEDGLRGMTSNPSIFEKAITGSTDYADALVELQKRKDLDAMGVYEIIAIKDIQDAAVPQRFPEQLTIAGLAPEPIGKEREISFLPHVTVCVTFLLQRAFTQNFGFT